MGGRRDPLSIEPSRPQSLTYYPTLAQPTTLAASGPMASRPRTMGCCPSCALALGR